MFKKVIVIYTLIGICCGLTRQGLALTKFDKINNLVRETLKTPKNQQSEVRVQNPKSNYTYQQQEEGKARIEKIIKEIEENIGSRTRGVRANKQMFLKGDLYISDTLVIEDTTIYQYGNIILYGSGMLKVKNAQLNVYGSVIGINQSKIIIDSSYFRILSQYPWQFMLGVVNTATLEIKNSELSYNFYPAYLNAVDDAKITITDTYCHDYNCSSTSGKSSCIMRNITGTCGEFHPTESSSVKFSNVKHLNIKIHFPDSSVADMSIPPAYDSLEHWQLDSLTSGISGIHYSVTIDTSKDVTFAVRAFSGSNVTLRDCEVQQFIIAPSKPDTFEISGLTNDTYYADWTAPLPDRILKLINTKIKSWSMQIMAPIKLTVKSSIFGELNCYADANVTVQNCMHTGSCGPNNVKANSLFFIQNSDFNTIVILEQNGFAAFYNSVIRGNVNVINVNDKAILVLLNTYFDYYPLILDSGTVFCASIDKPGQAGIDDSVKIEGSAWVDGGPNSIYKFDSYKLNYAYYSLENDSLGLLQPITGWIKSEVKDSVLATWSTYGIQTGYYIVELWIKDTFGDSINTYKFILLSEQGIEEIVSSGVPELKVSPNPFVQSTIIKLSAKGGSASGGKDLKIKDYNIQVYNMAGRLVEETKDNIIGRDLKAGIYFVKVKNYKSIKMVKLNP